MMRAIKLSRFAKESTKEKKGEQFDINCFIAQLP